MYISVSERDLSGPGDDWVFVTFFWRGVETEVSLVGYRKDKNYHGGYVVDIVEIVKAPCPKPCCLPERKEATLALNYLVLREKKSA